MSHEDSQMNNVQGGGDVWPAQGRGAAEEEESGVGHDEARIGQYYPQLYTF